MLKDSLPKRIVNLLLRSEIQLQIQIDKQNRKTYWIKMHKYIGVMFLYGYCLFNRTMYTYIYIRLYSHIDKLITV